MVRALAVGVTLVWFGCGSVKDQPSDAPTGNGDARQIDAPGSGIDAPPTAVPTTPVAPTLADPAYQGSQRKFTTQLGTTCTGRVAASMGGTGFCFLAADDSVKCAGVIGGVSFGMSFGTTGQANAEQIMVMFGSDNGMCITKTDHTVWCMGTNTNAFGPGNLTQNFARWTAHTDLAAIASGTWDQICGITTAGQILCGSAVGSSFGIPPTNQGAAGQTSMWVDTSGMVRPSDTTVLRAGESRTSCQVKANGLVCSGTAFGPTNGSVVMGSTTNSGTCWLTTDGTVSCSTGPKFATGKVLYLATDFYSDSMCAIYNDGSVWCVGPNNMGKLGTGNNLTLTTETMVAPAGSAHVACN
ncbi:hypothetical protein BH11MYX3_BH11MYX3_42530 [soil metagenome]